MSDGIECKCSARSESECCCEGVDWTPQREFELRAEVERLTAELAKRGTEKSQVEWARENADLRIELADLRSQQAAVPVGWLKQIQLARDVLVGCRDYPGIQMVSMHDAISELDAMLAAAPQPSQQAEPVDGLFGLSPEASCLCCGNIGVPKVWAINRPAIYVCETCHRRANAAKDYQASNEAEGDAYTHGFFDGLEEAPQPIQREDARDAARYRWLRDKGPTRTIAETPSMSIGRGPYIVIELPSNNSFSSAMCQGEAADALIDAAMQKCGA